MINKNIKATKIKILPLLLAIMLFLSFTGNMKVAHAVTPNFEIKLDESSTNLDIIDYSDKDRIKDHRDSFLIIIPEETVSIQVKFPVNVDAFNIDNGDFYNFVANTWHTINLNDYDFPDWLYDDYKSLDNTLTHYVLDVLGDLREYNIILQIGDGESNVVDKTALQAAINTNIDGYYYDENDRWNGNEYIGKGKSFYGSYLTAYNRAVEVNSNPDSTQGHIDEATSNLNNAISKLISTYNVNATLLYEKIQEAKNLPENQYTKPTWKSFQSFLPQAIDMRNSLYIADTTSPTAINVASYQINVDSTTIELSKRISELKFVAGEELVEKALCEYNHIKDIARYYDPAKMEESDYTAESWTNFISARTAAFNWINSHTAPAEGDPSADLYELINNVYPNFVYNCHFGLKNSLDSVTISLKVIDSLNIRAGEDIEGLSGYYNPSVKLNDGKHTVKDALKIASQETGKQLVYNTNYAKLKSTNATAVYINGVFYKLLEVEGSEFLTNINTGMRIGSDKFYPENFVLRDGDEVVFAYLQQPTFLVSSGAGYQPYQLKDIIDYVKSSRIKQDGKLVSEITVVEGESFNLTAEATKAYSQNFGAYFPYSSATLFESGRSSTDSSFIPATHKTDVTTDLSGNFSYTLYGEGYYTLTLHDLRENNYEDKTLYGLTAGDTIKVHVLKSNNPKAVKDNLIVELKGVYNAYDESYFTSSDWKIIADVYNASVVSINSLADLYDARQAQLSAIRSIKNIQAKTTEDNNKKLTEFKAILTRLSDNASLIDKSVEFLATDLVNRYEELSTYQKSRLTGIEENKYNSIKKALENGLPEAKEYTISLSFKADKAEAEAALKDMMGYVLKNGTEVSTLNLAYVSQRDIKGNNILTNNHMLFSVDESGNIKIFDAKAYPDNIIYLSPTIQKYASLFSEVAGNGWEMLNDGPLYQNNIAVKGRTILIGGIPYELKSITADGVTQMSNFQHNVTVPDWKSKEGLSYEVASFTNAGRYFIMPYKDITITVTWGPVGDNPNPGEGIILASEKSKASIEVNNAFLKYKSYEYTIENWTILIGVRDKGLEEIAKAKNILEVQTAKQTAITAMSAILKKTIDGSIPNFGKTIGTVDVYVENTTFPGGSFTGRFITKIAYEFGDEDTMMTIILRALKEGGFGWIGTGGSKGNIDDYTIEYLASINKGNAKLGEFDGEPGSGWMGTLNDFFVNEGFQHFQPTDGDEIRVMYTQNLGADLGGTWGNSDTSLKDLQLSSGSLYPSFSSEIYNYTLVMPTSSKNVKVAPTAANKNYLVKTFLNDKVTDRREGASFYKRTQYIPVKSGDYINIGVGEYAWPSMNNQETEARHYTGSWYKLNIITADNGASHVISLINELPLISNINISHKDNIKIIRSIFNILTASEKSKVTNIQKLEDAEKKIIFFEQIEAVKELLRKIPTASRITLSDKTIVMAADTAYKLLTDEQKLYITVGDVKNYNDAIDVLTKLGAFNSGSGPSKITGSGAAPSTGGTIEVQVPTKVVNNEAISKVSEEQIKDAIEKAKKAKDVSSITIKAEANETVTKSTVTMPKNSLTNISIESMDLNIETVLGIISLPEKALSEISKQSQGSSVEIVIENVASNKLNDEQKSITESSVVYDISIISEGKKISSFGGQKITISLPYELKDGQSKEKVSVWYMNDKGELEKISCTYDEKTGLASFITEHLSYYVVGYDNSINFIDVKESDWFYKHVAYVTSRGLFSGTSEDTFSPNTPMTRAMLVTVLHRLEGKPVVAKATSFVDLRDGEFYIDAVNWSLEKEIVDGVTKTEFKPKNNITREQLALMLYRYASSKNMVSDVTGSIEAFADKDKVNDWAKDAIKWAVGKGIITGKLDNKLDPTGSATRAEVAAMLQRYIENIK